MAGWEGSVAGCHILHMCPLLYVQSLCGGVPILTVIQNGQLEEREGDADREEIEEDTSENPLTSSGQWKESVAKPKMRPHVEPPHDAPPEHMKWRQQANVLPPPLISWLRHSPYFSRLLLQCTTQAQAATH